MSTQIPQPAPVKKPFYKKKRYVIPAAVIIVIGIATVAGEDNTEPTTATTTDTATAEPTTTKPTTDAPAEDKTAKTGQPVRDGKFEFVVSKQACGKKTVGTNQFMTAKAQGEFCVVPVTVKNIGDKAQMFTASNVKAAIGEAEYEADSAATMYAATTKTGDTSAFLEDINPGNQVKGQIVFDVPKGKKLDTVTLHDSAFSGGVTVSVK